MVRAPLIVPLVTLSGAAMLAPAGLSAFVGDFETAGAFAFWAAIVTFLGWSMRVAMSNRSFGLSSRSDLVSLAAAYLLVPGLLGLPVAAVMPQITVGGAWFEMVSSATTTGATVLTGDVPLAVHFWRALVAWLGGLLFLLAALAVLAPLRLGGFEIDVRPEEALRARRLSGAAPERLDRWSRHLATIAPAYATATAVLAILLIWAGDAPFVALVHAMSVMSTSGISPVGGLAASPAGIVGEVLIACALVFAISHRVLRSQTTGVRWAADDGEVRLAALVLALVPSVLFLRHWIGATTDVEGVLTALRAAWGALFTVLSFLTTLGFESAEWRTAQAWSDLPTPGIIFMGLAVMGGGVATTAGGVKLLRLYALYRHGLREIGRLSHPSSVGGTGMVARHIRREGAYVSWIFLMLFLAALAVVMLLLTVAQMDFVPALVMATAAMTTVGTLPAMMAADVPSWVALPDLAYPVLAVAMVLGRLETLALIALLAPSTWRG